MKDKNKNQKSDILLIVPPSPLVYPRMFVQTMGGKNPLGIGYLASCLRQEGFRVDCLNLYLGLKEIESLGRYISRTRPKIVGFSMMTENYQNGLLLAEFVKKNHPDIVTMFGGPHVTFMYEEALANDYVDIVARREAEKTMLELADYFVRGKGSLEGIKGIAYRSNGKVVSTAARSMIRDLDKLPFPVRRIPDLEGILSPEVSKETIITSRGCPGRCKFCCAAALSGGKYRLRSTDNVAAEVIEVKRNGSKEVFFGDDTVSADIPRLLDLCAALKEIGIEWGGECRVDAMSKELARTLVDSGCNGLQFGVESGSQDLLDEMRKGITLQQVEQAVRWATEAGLSVVCSLMIGLPEDTLETMEQTLDFADRLQTKFGIGTVVACTTPYPGTYYFNHAKELGMKISTFNYAQWATINPVMDLPHLTRWQIRNFYYECFPRLYRSLSKKYKIMYAGFTKYSLAKEGYEINFDHLLEEEDKRRKKIEN